MQFAINQVALKQTRFPVVHLGTLFGFCQRADRTGLYDLERHEGRHLRWTNGAAEFHVTPLAVAGPLSLLVKLWEFAAGTVAISVNDKLVLFTDLPAGGLETSLDLGAFSAGTNLVIRADSILFESDSDPRQLGVAIESLRLVHQVMAVPDARSQQARGWSS
jgi:hypothetical protein